MPSSERQAALHNTLLKALPDVVSGMPVLKLWELSRLIREDGILTALFERYDGIRILDQLRSNAAFEPFLAKLNVFLDEWGFRSSSELMLSIPSFQENPVPLLDILKQYASLDGQSPAELMRIQNAERIVEVKRVEEVLRRQRLSAWIPFLNWSHVFRVVLRWTQRCIVYRERARLKQALLYSRCRRIALAIGEKLAGEGRLGAADDVFFLTYQEIDSYGSGSAMFPDGLRPLIELHRGQHAELSAMRPPDSFVLPEGTYLPLYGDAARGAAETFSGTTLTGTGACGGQVTGRAAVLAGVEESGLISKGDVLITRQTDPGWALVFFLIKGLVIERGGMLSHGAIVAREFGLPCVVGAAGATQRIAHGQTVTIDGDKGEVRLGHNPLA